MKLLVFADLHLDAAFAWAGMEGARRRRQEIRETLVKILDLAREIGADAVLCAGDLYEHDRVTPDTGAFLKDRLGEAGRPIFIAPGNHDYFSDRSLYADRSWPSNVFVFREAGLAPVDLDDGLTLWGGAHCAPAGTQGFFEGGFKVDGGGAHIALFHGSEMSALPFEVEAKSPYAPFTAAQIEQAGLSHAFVGHFHAPSGSEVHTYPGNPQPLTFGEFGERGAVIAEVSPDGSVAITRRAVASSPAYDLEIDLSEAASFQDVRDLVTARLSGLSGVARISLTGELAPEIEIEIDGLRELEHGLDAPPVIDTSKCRVAYDLEGIALEPTVRGQFVRDVMASSDIPGEDERKRILVTGLRALDGRGDLDPLS